MTVLEIVIILAVVGAALLMAELCLPTHGVLGILGMCAILGAIGACFAISHRVGTVVLLGSIVATPFVWSVVLRIWPRTFMGRRLFLQSGPTPIASPLVVVGQFGKVTSELRPGGICDFDGERLEARSDHGVIAAGKSVRVVAVEGKRAIVRSVG